MLLNELNKLTPEEQEELLEQELRRAKDVPVFTEESMEKNAFEGELDEDEE